MEAYTEQAQASEVVIKTASGAILYDSNVFNQISERAFDPEEWRSSEEVSGSFRSGGRGSTYILQGEKRRFVLRRFLRGGLPGRLIKDHYFWNGEARTRSFAEWRLLSRLQQRGLPVPYPAAARYVRKGLFYQADLLTLLQPGICSLADRILDRPGSEVFWSGLGKALAGFHAEGVFHADLNVYNVQIDRQDRLFLLDFDRGEIRSAGIWRQKNLARLHRSLKKVKALNNYLHFNQKNWDSLLEGYFSASRSA